MQRGVPGWGLLEGPPQLSPEEKTALDFEVTLEELIVAFN